MHARAVYESSSIECYLPFRSQQLRNKSSHKLNEMALRVDYVGLEYYMAGNDLENEQRGFSRNGLTFFPAHGA